MPGAARPDAGRWWRACHADRRCRRTGRVGRRAHRARRRRLAVRRGAGVRRRPADLPTPGWRRMNTVDTPLRKILGVKTATALADHLDLRTAGDLLFHFPRRYDERGRHTDIRSLAVGEQATVMAQVLRAYQRPIRQGSDKMLEVTVGDGAGGTLMLTFFGKRQMTWRERDLRPGRWGLFAGKVTEFHGKRQLIAPEYVIFGSDEDTGEEIEEFAGALIPVYPAAAKVPTWTIARSVRVLLDTVTPPDDPLPANLRAHRRLVDLRTALRDIHRPPSREALGAARRRLKWDEAFAVQLTLVQR